MNLNINLTEPQGSVETTLGILNPMLLNTPQSTRVSFTVTSAPSIQGGLNPTVSQEQLLLSL